jgi:P-type Ca2+ transporter type 2C
VGHWVTAEPSCWRNQRRTGGSVDHWTVQRPASPFARAVVEVAASFGVDPFTGLSQPEAIARLIANGPNAIRPVAPQSVWRLLLTAAREPFVLLLAASGLLAVLVGEVRDGLLVLVGLVPIVGADVLTEYRGDRALEALQAATAPRARVRRFGRAIEVPSATVVVGDVVLLQVGDVVPADLRCHRAERLVLNRSALTGESVPEPASVDPDPAGTVLADRRSMLFAGTSVVGGRGEGIVVATGASTELGRIAGGLTSRERRRSPLQRELDRLVRILLLVALGLIVVTSGLGFLRGQGLGANILAGISAAIAAIPEEPPVLLAVILGLGAYRLLRRGVLVRRLNAEEMLGAIDLILTDKTGTLTENRLTVSSVRTLEGPPDPAREVDLLALALRAEEDAWPRDGVMPGSFTRALAEAITARGGSTELAAQDLVDADPPSDLDRFSRTASRHDGRFEEVALGAPEAIIALASSPEADSLRPARDAEADSSHPAADAEADSSNPAADQPPRQASAQPRPVLFAWRRRTAEATSAGERVLALARRVDGGSWQIEALIGFADPPRPGIAEALGRAQGAGIQTIVVTGDHPQTAAAIARSAGLAGERIVTGTELAGWDDARLAAELPGLHVVARSTPEDKERLVAAAHRSGRLVAVTGDGVNDAPALHAADVAVAMGSGTAVAREASDLILGDDAFGTLVYGIAEGRRIVDNVQKGLVFLVSTHVALLGFLLIATLAGIGQPLLPIQILWLELFIDSSTSVAFEREPPEPGIMERPPRPVGQPLLSSGLLARIGVAGGFSALAALVLLLWHDQLTGRQGGFEEGRWLAFTALVVAQAVRAYANRSLRVPTLRLAPNRVLLVACAAVIVVQAAIPALPALADAFRASPLDAADWLLVAIVAFGPALLAEIVRSYRGTAWVA